MVSGRPSEVVAAIADAKLKNTDVGAVVQPQLRREQQYSRASWTSMSLTDQYNAAVTMVELSQEHDKQSNNKEKSSGAKENQTEMENEVRDGNKKRKNKEEPKQKMKAGELHPTTPSSAPHTLFFFGIIIAHAANKWRFFFPITHILSFVELSFSSILFAQLVC